MRRYLTAAAIVAGLASPAGAQSGLTFVVNNAGDGADAAPGNGICATGGGACTLRAAIQEANAAAGPDAIHFAIGSGLQTITVGSTLPAVSERATIDGTTQPGFAGSPIVVVNGGGSAGPGLLITGGDTTVRGLVVGNFKGHGIELRTGGGNVLEGNYVGMGASGTSTLANTGHGVVVANSPNNRIGGPSAAQRNLISKNMAKGNGGGIVLEGAGGNVIQGNFIGTDITGMVEHPNEARGIAIIGSSNNLIGGPGAGAGNLIAGNRATGVRMLGGSSNNVVQGNLIGVNRALTGVIPNDRGVQIRDGDNNQVLGNVIMGNTYDGVLVWGGNNSLIHGNYIAYNGYGPIGDPMEAGYFGIWIASGTGNQVLSNAIYGNYHLGINLSTDLFTANDAGDGDGGANNLQNSPRITSAVVGGANTAVVGSLNSSPNSAFRLQFFASPACDSVGSGEGQYLVGETTLASDASGNAAFAIAIGAALPAGWAVTATATDPGGNTSEFSPCAGVR